MLEDLVQAVCASLSRWWDVWMLHPLTATVEHEGMSRLQGVGLGRVSLRSPDLPGALWS